MSTALPVSMGTAIPTAHTIPLGLPAAMRIHTSHSHNMHYGTYIYCSACYACVMLIHTHAQGKAHANTHVNRKDIHMHSNSLTTLRDRARQLRKTDELKALEQELSVKVNELEDEYNKRRQELINKFYNDAEQLTLTQN